MPIRFDTVTHRDPRSRLIVSVAKVVWVVKTVETSEKVSFLSPEPVSGELVEPVEG